MIKALKLSFKLRYAYSINSIIFSLKQIPIIKRIVSDSLYGNSGLNAIGVLFAIIKELFSIFVAKALYIILFIFSPLALYQDNASNAFITIIVFLTLVGAISNTNVFNPSKDKYYAIILMHMNAKLNVLTNYYYFLTKILVGMTPFVLIFGRLANVPLLVCLLIPIMIVLIKIIVCALYLKSNKTSFNENKFSFVKGIIVGIFAVLAYLLPYLNIVITPSIFYIIFSICLIIGIGAFIFINSYSKYNKLCKELLKMDTVIFNIKKTSAQTNKNLYLNKIDDSKVEISNKDGYAYFNELFVRRHKSILMSSAIKYALFFLGAIIIAGIASYLYSSVSSVINKGILQFLPYLLFIMYFSNRGEVITTAMFMNCDHSMLTYHFYRQPQAILMLFKERLKSLIKINMIPSIVLALGLPLLLLVSGGTDNYLNYLIIFVSVIAMTIFFSVHHLVIYYLLQPYNKDVELKSTTYQIVVGITYAACYFTQEITMTNLFFGSIMSAFTILYVMIALYLAYKYAPKTFRIK